MSNTILIGRFTQRNERVSGQFLPQALPRLRDFLAQVGGEICYTLQGAVRTNIVGSQQPVLECIISGWFFSVDPITLQAARFEVSSHSRLVLVKSESELPSLDAEADDEDYVVCGAEMDILERVEEEVLLALPTNLPMVSAENQRAKPTVTMAAPQQNSPFAELAKLKKSSH